MGNTKNDDGMERLPLSLEVLGLQEGDEIPEVRRIWNRIEEKWYYSVIDFVRLLTGSSNANVYWSALKKRNETDPGFQDALNDIKEIPLRSKDGRLRGSECIPREAMLRVVQNIGGERAEKVKLWLARVGEEKLQDIEQKTQVEQLREWYISKGRTPAWTDLRIQNLLARNSLTDEWLTRGAQQHLHFGLLTFTIHKGTFGIPPTEHHQDVKHLPKGEPPRDHYTDEELAMLTLTELASRRMHIENDSQGVPQLLKDAQAAGEFGGNVRKQFEELTGQPVVSSQNFLDQPKKTKRLKQPELFEEPGETNEQE